MKRSLMTRIGPWPLATLALGLALTAYLTQQRSVKNDEVAAQRFQTLASRIQHDIVEQFERYEYGLRGARGVVLTAGEKGLTRPIMEAYAQSREIDTEFPGARGFGFIRRVPVEKEAAFLASAKADGAPDFRIKQLSPNALERFVIQYIEPVGRNLQAVGLDIGSERNRREAAENAMRTGRATLTGPITLVQATGAPLRSFLVMLPVYRPAVALDTPEQRWAAGYGWTYAPLVTDEVLSTVDFEKDSVLLTLTDATDPNQPDTFYTSGTDNVSKNLDPADALTATLNRQLFGRTWILALQAKPAFFNGLELTSPSSILGWGALMTGLITLLHAFWLAIVARRRESAQAQARLATIVANASDAIIGESMDGKVILWNAAAERLFGQSREEVENRPLAQVLLPADRASEDQALVTRIAAGEAIPPFETTFLHRKGHLIPVAMTVCAIADERGRVIGAAKLLRDISDRKAYEARLVKLNSELESKVLERTQEARSSKEMLKTVLNAVPMMVGYWDRSSVLRVANRAYCEYLGRAEEDLIGHPASEVIVSNIWTANQPLIDKVLRGEPQSFEYSVMPPGGSAPIELHTHMLPRIEHGEVTGFYAISQDLTERITQRKLLETALAEQQTERERLRESEAFLERVGQVAGVGGWMFDLQTQRFTWSKQTCRLMDAPQDHSPSMNEAMGLCVGADRSALEQSLKDALEQRKPFDLVLRLHTLSGRPIWGRIVGEPLTNPDRPDSPPLRLLGAFQDITAQQAASQALSDAKLAADAANQSKSMFLANMSHEIRTPLNAVLGISHLLSATPLDADQRQLLAKSQMAGQSLLGIVNDVLDLAKIEAGEMALAEAPYQLRTLVEELVLTYAPQAQAKGIALRLQLTDDLPLWLMGDVDRMRQMLVNLVSNAIKFTQEGMVRVEAATRAGTEGPRLRITVSDTGIGITPAAQATLFEPFTQADLTTTRQYGGTGLGLSIVKRLAESMDGSVGLDSTPGQGSRFWIDLPLQTTSEGTPRSDAQAPQTMEVVVVDDDKVDRMALTAQVKSLGWRAMTVDSGEALIRLFRQRTEQGQKMPDAILVDWDMPGLNGVDALGQIVDLFGRESLPPALIVSAKDSAQIVREDTRHLVDQVIKKPPDISALFNGLSQSLARREGPTSRLLGAADLASSSTAWLQGARILLVDDSEINLEIARRLLERQGAEVQTCTDGLQALHRLEAPNHGFDVVLMDVQMPVMDGLTATRAIRANPAIARLPIIAVTAGALKEERRRALAAGMNDFLAKPLDPKALIATVRQHVEQHRSAPMPVTGARPTQAAPAHWPQIEGIDAEDAAVRLGGDRKMFKRMLGWLVTDYSDIATELAPQTLSARLQDAEVRQRLCARVHKLRGSAGTLGAQRLQQAATAAEADLKAPQADASASAQALLEALEQLTEACQPFLTEGVSSAAQAGAPAPLEQADLEELQQLLGAQDFHALERFHAVEKALESQLTARDFAALQAAMQQLDFAGALALLARHGGS